MRDRGLRACRDFVACTRVLSRTPRALRDGAGRIACSCVTPFAHGVCVRVQRRAVVGGVHFCIVEAWESLLCKMSGSGCRAASGICGRGVVAEPPGEAASRGEAGSGVAEERGRSDVQQQTCMCSVYEDFFVHTIGIGLVGSFTEDFSPEDFSFPSSACEPPV